MSNKKKKVNEGASVRKASRSRASRATLRSGPAKKRGPSPSARSREEWPIRTRLQRRTLYRAMLAHVLVEDNYAGFCQLLSYHFDMMTPGYNDGLESLPELHKHSGGRDGTVQNWFPSWDWEPRIAALKDAIRATAPPKRVATGIVAKARRSQPKQKPGAKSSSRSPKKQK